MIDSWRGAPARRHGRCRSDPERRRALLHPDSRGHGSRGHQGRAAGTWRRREGVGAALLGPGERDVHRAESQQEEPGPRSQVPGRARDPAATGPSGRCVRPEPPARGRRRARPRLRRGCPPQSEDRLLLDHRIRSAGAAPAPARIRSVDASVQRPDVGEWPSRDGAGPGWDVDRRHGHRDVGGPRRGRRASPARRDRARRRGHDGALRDGADVDVLSRHGLSRLARGAPAAGLGDRDDRAVPGVPDVRRLRDDRRGLRRVVRASRGGARLPRARRRRAVQGQSRAGDESRGARRGALEADARAEGGRARRRAPRRRGAGGPDPDRGPDAGRAADARERRARRCPPPALARVPEHRPAAHLGRNPADGPPRPSTPRRAQQRRPHLARLHARRRPESPGQRRHPVSAATYRHLLVTRSDDQRIVTVTLNRPEQMNAMNTAMGEDLLACFDGLQHDPNVPVAVSTGPRDRAFCAGGDLKERNAMTDEAWRAQHVIFEQAAFRVLRCPVPVIAAVEGFALAGGCELAILSDFIVAGDTAVFGVPETTLGIFPGIGGTQLLPRIVGAPLAKELIFTGRRMKADEAKAAGLINHMVPAGQARATATQIAITIAKNGPIAVRQAKKAIAYGAETDLDTAMILAIEAYNATIVTEDRLEGVRAFNEKRKPELKGK